MSKREETTLEEIETGKRAVLLLGKLIDAFPEHETDEAIDGPDTVDWLMKYITEAKELL